LPHNRFFEPLVYESKSRLRLSAKNDIYALYTNVSAEFTLLNSAVGDLPKLQERTKEIKAKAMLHICENEVEAAITLLTTYLEFVTRLRNKKAQLQYLFGSFILTALTLILGGIALYSELSDIQSVDIQLQFAAAIFMAAMGGFLSVLVNLKKLQVDVESGVAINVFGGISRIMIAIIAGIAALVLVKADIMFGFINKTEYGESFYGLLTLCFLSGFSEGLIPNVLKRIENSTISSEQ
jgi:hypothetical protein